MKKEQFVRMTEMAFYIRGIILNEIAFIERCMEQYISKCLCDNEDKKNDLIEYILSNNLVSLRLKKSAYLKLLKKYNPEIYYDGMEKQLTEIIDARNSLAHDLLDTDTEGKKLYIEKGAIRFVNQSKKEKSKEYTVETASNFIIGIDQIRSKIIESVPFFTSGEFTEEEL